MKKYIIALDQGTTSSRAIAFDIHFNVKGISQLEFTQIYPKSGWVEHDPHEILVTQKSALTQLIAKLDISSSDIAAIGITNQRETTVVWDRTTGEPIYNAIVWQCRRSSQICEELRSQSLSDYINQTTGLVIDAYFSGTKIKWILENVEGARKKAENGDLIFGTIDSWLIWHLTEKKLHITDYTNASRTMLFDIHHLQWDEKILQTLDIPKSMLPTVKNSSEVYGEIILDTGHKIPISGIAGDQQAALFGQACYKKGDVKNTYGTGCFLLMHTGKKAIQSKSGLLTTIAVGLNHQIEYALEGSIFVGGASIQWLRDELKLIQDSEDSEYFASKVQDSGGVYVVPAFVGLGAPYWDMYARGTIIGITRGTNRNHIVRATTESIAYQSKDLIHAMQNDSTIEINRLKVDGGASRNNFLMQFQSDILGVEVERPQIVETTALGAACLAGLAVGFWKNKIEIEEKWQLNRKFIPKISNEKRNKLYKNWQKAVTRAQNWVEN